MAQEKTKEYICRFALFLFKVAYIYSFTMDPFLEGLMFKLRFQYFGHLMRRTDSLEKTLMLGKIGRQEKGMTEDEMVGWHH